MRDILESLEKSYLSRCGDPAEARAAWRECAAAFPPSLDTPPGGGPLPSTAIALGSGDLGLALLWIVQAAVVRPLASAVSREADKYPPGLDSITPTDIGALANSEDPSKPVILGRASGSISLSGKKKYITGGRYADFILVTARDRGDDKVSALAYLPCCLLPEGALADLDLGMLRTANHASLVLDDMVLPADSLAVMDPAALRRLLKRRGIIEQFLILESFLAAMLYLARRLEALSLMGHGDVTQILPLLERQRRASEEAIAADRAGERIDDGGADPGAVLGIFSELSARFTAPFTGMPQDLASRYADLTLFSRFRA